MHRLLYYGFGRAFRDSTLSFVVDLFPFLQHPDFDGAYTVFKAASFVVAAANGFYWNRRWTFKIRGNAGRGRQFVRFYIVAGIGLLLNVLIASQIHKPEAGNFNYYLSLATATLAVMLWNFAGHKFWTFRSRSAPGPGANSNNDG